MCCHFSKKKILKGTRKNAVWTRISPQPPRTNSRHFSSSPSNIFPNKVISSKLKTRSPYRRSTYNFQFYIVCTLKQHPRNCNELEANSSASSSCTVKQCRSFPSSCEETTEEHRFPEILGQFGWHACGARVSKAARGRSTAVITSKRRTQRFGLSNEGFPEAGRIRFVERSVHTRADERFFVCTCAAHPLSRRITRFSLALWQG